MDFLRMVSALGPDIGWPSTEGPTVYQAPGEPVLLELARQWHGPLSPSPEKGEIMTDHSNTTKRTNVLRLLRDPIHRNQSDRAIARLAGVNHKTVGKWRRELTGEFPTPPQPCLLALTGETMLSAGCPPALAQRIHARLATMPPAQRQRAERLLVTLIL
jgi:hypothetical protein